MTRIVRFLAALRDPVRLRLLRLLQGRELCVCELVDTFRLPQYAISRHLRALRTLGLVAARRDGRWMHYRLGRQATGPGLAADLLRVLSGHLANENSLRNDDMRLRRRLAVDRAGRCLTGVCQASPRNRRKRLVEDRK